jgi:hypothetical protein
MTAIDAERRRLEESHQEWAEQDWKLWGPYLAERAWGTVREDYSDDGDAWNYFTHDMARSRAYRWNEDGLGGISDRRGRLCFALALWNGVDPILKERAFGLTGHEGNHGEDVKDYFYYLDNTPTHSYMKFLYKYPQREFPYAHLVDENGRRGKFDPEYELIDTGIFDDNRYWDVTIEYAKASQNDILIRVTATNRGPDTAVIDLLPTLWFRNTWSWGRNVKKGRLKQCEGAPGVAAVEARHPDIGLLRLLCQGDPEALYTENDTNAKLLFGTENATPYVKDAFHDYVIHGRKDAVNPAHTGTKMAARYRLTVAAGESATIRLRLSERRADSEAFHPGFDTLFATRIAEADAFYHAIGSPELSDDVRNVQRQAFAGMLWQKQYYRYNVLHWLEGDPCCPPPPPGHCRRNADWAHLNASEVISMPDCWEYPWFAAWDLSFHCIPLAIVDPWFAKEQLLLLCHEWFQHPNGQLPAYEWAFGDVNPPVTAWAALRVFRIERRVRGIAGDYEFLKKIFHRMLLYFTWWVNRKDAGGRNIFQGGFLGLDNVGVFDRSKPLPGDSYLEQSDGTSWMAMFCLNMLGIAVELTHVDKAYEDMCTKFFEHFVYIAHAMNNFADEDLDLWDDVDGFYYDVLREADGRYQFLKVRSVVGLIPLLAVETIDEMQFETLPDFRGRVEYFLRERPDLCKNVADLHAVSETDRRLLSIVDPDKLKLILTKMLDEAEFLSPHGLRSLSRYHEQHPYSIQLDGTTYAVDYEPAESTTGVFGGNSNWRGPIWFPINYLLVEALQKFDYYLGPNFLVEFPTGSGQQYSLSEVAAELSRRLTRTFLSGEDGRRPVFGGNETFQTDPHWRDLIPFHEYFHGDNGAGLGASHQTGWTGLVAKLIEQSGE